jgi:Xaa-Pro dipeptidase
MTTSRFSRLFSAMDSAGMEVVALNPGPSLTYLTGLTFHLMERPTVLLAALPDQVGLILPRLEVGKLSQSSRPMQAFTFDDNPALWPDTFRKACQALGIDGKTVGVEPIRLRYLELGYLQQAAPKAQFVSAADILEGLRMQKDAAEVAKMRQAVRIAQDSLEATLKLAQVGMTEREFAAELTIQMLRGGADAGNPFAPIVASGPNSANPHAGASERRLTAGDLLVIDWGASYQGYVSDLTRTFAIRDVDAQMRAVAAIVAEANTAGRAAARPGIPAGDVDRAARAVIERAGYGEYFTHRTGHGIGMEGHEPPYMFAENSLELAPGMAFTVEPGIYLTGKGGVRVEDNVVITDTGAETLSDLPRELRVIA